MRNGNIALLNNINFDLRESTSFNLFALPLKIFLFLTGSTENWLLSSGM